MQSTILHREDRLTDCYAVSGDESPLTEDQTYRTGQDRVVTFFLWGSVKTSRKRQLHKALNNEEEVPGRQRYLNSTQTRMTERVADQQLRDPISESTLSLHALFSVLTVEALHEETNHQRKGHGSQCFPGATAGDTQALKAALPGARTWSGPAGSTGS